MFHNVNIVISVIPPLIDVDVKGTLTSGETCSGLTVCNIQRWLARHCEDGGLRETTLSSRMLLGVILLSLNSLDKLDLVLTVTMGR